MSLLIKAANFINYSQGYVQTGCNWVATTYPSVKFGYTYIKNIHSLEFVQDVLGIINFSKGAKAFHHFTQETEESLKREFKHYTTPTWKNRARKTITFFGNLSLIGHAITSKPAGYVWRSIAQIILNPMQLEKLLTASSSAYLSNLHLLIARLAFVFGLPGTALLCYDSYYWIKKRVKLFYPLNGRGDGQGPSYPFNSSPPPFRRKETVMAVTTVFESLKNLFG